MVHGKRNDFPKTALLATAAAGFGILFLVMRHRNAIISKLTWPFRSKSPLAHRHIRVVSTAEECNRVVNRLKKDCEKYAVLGFDCEWVSVKGKRHPTALLQLSSQEGLCGLFRLCHIKHIPHSLRQLLENEEIMKVGVAPFEDAQKLAYDYGVGVASTLDLRFVAALLGHSVGGLASLSKTHLDVELNKSWRLACSDWEAPVLSTEQLKYAANDAFVAVEIFKKFAWELQPKKHWYSKQDVAAIFKRLEPFLDARYKGSCMRLVDEYRRRAEQAKRKTLPSQSKPLITKNIPLYKPVPITSDVQLSAAANETSPATDPPAVPASGSTMCTFKGQLGTKGADLKKIQKRGICAASRLLYDNCLLQAPDGDLLCTIDRRKAQWYLDQGLGEEIRDNCNFTVRLNFEPAGRAVGDVGSYYRMPKENQCVVCGSRDAFVRKNVVPREYRKHFPVIMKSHTSHDVVPLCLGCHQISDLADLKVRQRLADMCEAPFKCELNARKLFEVPDLKKVKSAGRALLLNGHKIPAERQEELKQIILQHYGLNELTPDILTQAADMETTMDNEHYCSHGARVVQKFRDEHGGLIELERIWRQHFLDVMRPQHLPTLWSVNHNADRLAIRADEGRIEQKDLNVAGLTALTINDTKTASSMAAAPPSPAAAAGCPSGPRPM